MEVQYSPISAVCKGYLPQKSPDTRWWFQIFFTPVWGRFPIWLIFFKGVETTNQDKVQDTSIFGTKLLILPWKNTWPTTWSESQVSGPRVVFFPMSPLKTNDFFHPKGTISIGNTSSNHWFSGIFVSFPMAKIYQKHLNHLTWAIQNIRYTTELSADYNYTIMV